MHQIKFDTPIKSVDFKNAKSARYMFLSGCFFTIATLSLWMFLTNHKVNDLDECAPISIRAYYKLGEQGITWDRDNLIWEVR